MIVAAAINLRANARFNTGGKPAAIRTRFSTIKFPRLVTDIYPAHLLRQNPSIRKTATP